MFRHHSYRRLWLFALVGSFVACKSMRVNPVATPIKADGQALTSIGESYEASFAPDGQRIVYVSSARRQHKQSQVYELDLKSRRERRLTFQGSFVHSPQYSPKGDSIIYSSGTDELKEDPPLLHDSRADANFIGPKGYLDRAELYLHRLQGLEMQRLTHRPGFDGEAKFLSPTHILFTRRDRGNLAVLEMPLKGHFATPLRLTGPRAAMPAATVDGKRIAWIEFSEDFSTSSLKMREGQSVRSLLDDISALKQGPVWSPDGQYIVFSMNYPKKDQSEIYLVKYDGTCLTPLTSLGFRSEQPAVSPAQDAYLFTSNQAGNRQIYIKAFPKTLDCALPPELIEKEP